MNLPEIYYAPTGPDLLIGYYWILMVPLVLIVPFSAFRSLASEREDGTYELLSITTLNSRQIVTGKLGSAVLQMIVYFSALAPCIAFTYLLRGVDIITIVYVLFYAFLASLLFSAFGLLAATALLPKHTQTLLSVLLLIGLMIATMSGCSLVAAVVSRPGNLEFDESYFWIGNLCFLTFYGAYFAMIVTGAAAQLSFASDNRSTKLRAIMLIQQVLALGWVLYFWVAFPARDAFYVILTLSGIHWTIMGALMTGELAEISPRVKRSLPQTQLGRWLFTWFNPGSGTGYVFAIINLVAVTTVVFIVGMVAQAINAPGAPRNERMYLFGGLICAYAAAYLGVGRLLVLVLRNRLQFGLLLPFMVHAVLLFGGMAGPAFIQAWLEGFGRMDYAPLQVSNWAWTLMAAVDGDLAGQPLVPVVVGLAGIGVFVINLAVAAKEIEQVREEAPQRVIEDELELHPELAPAPSKPASPWDHDDDPLDLES